MLYVEVKKQLDEIIFLLNNNYVPIPEALLKTSNAFKQALDSGDTVAKEDLDMISRYLFPDVGMGWRADWGYQLDKETLESLNKLTEKLFKAINNT